MSAMMRRWPKRWNRSSTSLHSVTRSSSAKDQLAGGEAERVVRLFHPDLCMSRVVLHDHIDHHATAAAAIARPRGAWAGCKHFRGLDESPLTAGAPVAVKLVERIFRMILGMLLPL